MICKVGDGNSTSFWHDCWLLDIPLKDHARSQHQVEGLMYTVRNMWKEGIRWDLACLQPLLLNDITSKLLAINWTVHTSGRMFRSPIGMFSSRSARELISDRIGAVTHKLWGRIWKFKGRSRASLTFRADLHRALPTAVFLWRCHIIE